MNNLTEYKDNILKKYGKYCVDSNNENPEVSVIIPCYNAEKYIEECLVSLIRQTFKNIEIICVNDGSSDSTSDIIRNFSEIDSRVIRINQENKGVSEARNTGFKISRGKYITFLDSDDWLDNNYIEKLYNAITEKSCDIAVSGMIRKRIKTQKYRLFFEQKNVYLSLQDKIDICKIPACCYVCGKLFKRELINNFPFKSGVYFEDVIWTPEILKRANGLVTVPETFYYYRVNNSSIVKSVQSVQKQHDSYVAKSYIVKFFNENNLVLNKKNKQITKYINYILGIPVIKVKESENIETTLLFGFIPLFKKKASLYYKFKKKKKIFLFKDMDSHIYVNLFGMHMGFKHKQNFNFIEVNSSGVTNNKRAKKLIVSLTSFPARINKVYKTINTLLNQTVKPDNLILWLAKSQFPGLEKDLPDNLLKLKDFGLEIKFCEDIGSYKKLIPALKAFPEDIIVTADDDMYYQKDWLESLYDEYLKNPKNIYTRRACRIERKRNSFVILPHYSNNNFKADFSNQLMGGAGTIFPPHSLYKDVFDTEVVKTLIPTYDDIYFWAMAVMKGTKIGLVNNKDLNFYNVEDTQSEALCKINGQSSRINDIEAFNRVFEKYPKIITRLKS